MKDGIYFNIPEEEYHEIPCFSGSLADKYLIDREEGWLYDARNPDRVSTERTPAMELGTAVHSMLLEPDVFDALYVKKPTYDDFPGHLILDKNDDLKAFLADVGEKKTGTKADLISRASPFLDPGRHILWDNVMATFNENVEDHGLRVISNDFAETLAGISGAVEARPNIQKILSEGYPEVTLIWTDEETGVKCKCRFDYLRTEAIAEVKTFSMVGSKPIDRAISKEIEFRLYNMKYVIYYRALQQTIKSILKKKAVVEGDVDPKWLEEFLLTPNKQYFWIFARTQRPYQCRIKEGQERAFAGATPNVYFTQGEVLFKRAMLEYLAAEKEVIIDNVKTLQDEDVMGVMYQTL